MGWPYMNMYSLLWIWANLAAHPCVHRAWRCI